MTVLRSATGAGSVKFRRAPFLQTRPLPLTVWQHAVCCDMKRRLMYGFRAIVLTINLVIGARVFLSSAQAAEKDSPYPSLELFSYVMEKVRKDYVDGQKVTYQ